MYQSYYDIFLKLSIYISIIRKYKDDIKEVQISNEIESVTGRYYCKVYVDLILKEDTGIDKRDLRYYIHTEFSRHYIKEGFSFYLGSGFNYKDDDKSEFLDNKEQEVHYNYIWNLMQWYLEADKVKVESSQFKSMRMLRYERERELNEYMEKRQKVESCTQNLPFEKGQLITIKGWSDLRVGEITKLVQPSRRQTFQLEANEIKKDLSIGKVKMFYLNKTDIYAIVQRDRLSKNVTKEDLISLIKKGEKFEGLIWRRPNDLWD
jgi:hypothetical protein